MSTSVDELKAAHQALRAAVPSSRQKAHREEGMLAQTFREAMRIWDEQKADGMSLANRVAGLTCTLRACWPQTREWKYLCEACDDRGLVMTTCPGDSSCNRYKPHLPHDYGVPCHCSVGNRFRKNPLAEQDYTAAARSKPKSKGFTKWGQ